MVDKNFRRSGDGRLETKMIFCFRNARMESAVQVRRERIIFMEEQALFLPSKYLAVIAKWIDMTQPARPEAVIKHAAPYISNRDLGAKKMTRRTEVAVDDCTG